MSNRIPKCDVKIYANVRKTYPKISIRTQKVRKKYVKRTNFLVRIGYVGNLVLSILIYE